MGAFRLAAGLVAVVAIACWNAAVTRVIGDDAVEPPDADVDTEVVEHGRNWYDYLRGFDAHHGDGAGDHPEHGSVRRGLERWLASGCLRGYTLGDHTYVCSNAPRVLRVHQAGHTPAFGDAFEPLRAERRADGGLPDEPLRTLDVMLPGAVPHTLLRLRDPRGLGETYNDWLREGRIARR